MPPKCPQSTQVHAIEFWNTSRIKHFISPRRLPTTAHLQILTCNQISGLIVCCYSSRTACRYNTTQRRYTSRRSALVNRKYSTRFTSNEVVVLSNTADDVIESTANGTTSYRTTETRRHSNVTRPKHRLIRGSKQAATITKKELLRTDWCHTEPFQQVIHEVISTPSCINTVLIVAHRLCPSAFFLFLLIHKLSSLAQL